MAEKRYLRATTGFVLPGPVIVKAGQIVAADDKVVKGREMFFEAMDEYVERATRAPGEKRLGPRRDGDTVVMAAEKSARRSRRPRAAAPDRTDRTNGTDRTDGTDDDTEDKG